ncbi:TPA: hypothetical protein ACMDVK_003784 [Vibrio parahaemolyticus]
MGQVRDNLPNGNPRNKIEYLANLLDSMETGGEPSLTYWRMGKST